MMRCEDLPTFGWINSKMVKSTRARLVETIRYGVPGCRRELRGDRIAELSHTLCPASRERVVVGEAL